MAKAIKSKHHEIVVNRIGYASLTINIDRDKPITQEQAEASALEIAGDYEFSEHSSDYELENGGPVTFFAMCGDSNGDSSNDFMIQVTCDCSKKDAFKDTWIKCRKKAIKDPEYSVNDIYDLMAKKGYKVIGLFHDIFVEG